LLNYEILLLEENEFTLKKIQNIQFLKDRRLIFAGWPDL